MSSTKPLKNHSLVRLQSWLPALAPALKDRWQTAGENLPALSDWLALLRLADTEPQKLAAALEQFLKNPRSGNQRQQAWITLSQLFALTFEVMQAAAAQLNHRAWPHLLALQNRILMTAAAVTLTRPERPSTDILTRRALYLQTITALNRQIFEEQKSAQFLDEAINLVQQNFGYTLVALFLLDTSQSQLTLQSTAGAQPSTRQLPALRLEDKTAMSQAARTRQAVIIADFDQQPDVAPHPLLPQARSQMSIPLLVEQKLLGVLDVVSDQAQAFQQEDDQILRALADHLAIAIENFHLQSALQRHTREQKVLYETNVALGTTLDSTTILERTARKIVEAVAGKACLICKVDERAATITAVAQYIAGPAAPSLQLWRKLDLPIPLAEDPMGQQVLKTKRPVIGRASSKQPALWRHVGGDSGSPPAWGTVLALPFEFQKQSAGLIEIYDHDSDRRFLPTDIELCQILATQTTLALERSRLFEKTRQRLNQVAALYTMFQKISSNLDLQVMMDNIVVALRQVMDCRGCCIFLLDPNTKLLEIKAADGLKPEWQASAKLRVGQGVAGQAVARGETIYLADTQADPDFIFFDASVRSVLVTPLRAQDEIIGAINVDHDRPNAFGPPQEQLLKIAAAQVGAAIENARLFTKISTERQQNQAIIQHMADGLLVIDSQGVIVTCNPALTIMLGLSRDQIIGQKIGSARLHPHLAGVTSATTQRARTGVLAKEIMLGNKTLQIFITQMVDEDKRSIGEVRVVHDVTKEREIEQLKADFMSTISHELRTPLFSIQGFAQILLEDDPALDPDMRREFLTTIHVQAVQLSEMVNNLLDMAKFDEGKVEFERREVAILELLQQAYRKLQGFAHQQKVDLRADLPLTLSPIIGDAARLEQVVTNLLGNAIKFTPAGGQVTLLASLSPNEILIEVKDTGIGIPAEALKQIFLRYYQAPETTTEAVRGTGLGLHIAKQIVEGHGGRIWAESVVNQGSTFRFTLPLPGYSEK